MLERSYDTVKIKSLDKNRILRKLRHIARGIIKRDQVVVEISLFGSLAKGNFTGASDADILIVLKNDSRRFIDRIPNYLGDFLQSDVPVDVFPYTVIELEELGKGKNSFIKKIQSEKIILSKRKAS